MCFSATASFTAGAALVAVGVLTLRRATRIVEIPYAAIPLLFGLQQLIEGGLWLTFAKTSHLNEILTHIYALFSHVIWPVFVPLAVLILERVRWRRAVLTALAISGASAGFYLLYFWAVDPTTSRVVGQQIIYDSPHFYIVPILVLYVLSTCLSSLVSSDPAIRWFGAASLASYVFASAFYSVWFISVWCFFAAVMSGTVWLYFRRPHRWNGSKPRASTSRSRRQRSVKVENPVQKAPAKSGHRA